MKTRSNIFLLLSSICSFFACEEKPVHLSQTIIPPVVAEASKCISPVLAKGSISVIDSLFSYSFFQDLTLDFSVQGNCCPDSNRFEVNIEIRNDTILVSVNDTAKNLCRCNCLYMIHLRASDLAFDRYVVRCSLRNGYNDIDPIHLVTVMRRNSQKRLR
jgi:hypothetical protein